MQAFVLITIAFQNILKFVLFKTFKNFVRTLKHCWIFILSLILPTGGPPYFESPYRHRHAGCHFKGNAKSLLCHHLQAGGQHQWGGLDGLQARQESQGRLRIVHRYTPKNNLDAVRRHTFKENTQDGIYTPHELTTNHKLSCWLQLQSFHHPSLGFN